MWKDHSAPLTHGQSISYIWQLTEADDKRPDEIYTIIDAANEWFEGGYNDFNVVKDPGFYLMTDIAGILVNLILSNRDDLLAASTFEITHGAAYALATDFQINSEENHAPICRAAMKQKDMGVQKIHGPTSSAPDYCGVGIETWILPVSKYLTRGTVHTKIWANLK